MSNAPRVILACPECGAPLPPEAADRPTKCPQCGATSAPAPKPAAPIILEYVVKQGEETKKKLPCPRCAAPLFEGTSEDVTLFGCGVCGGIFVDNEGCQAIMKRGHAGVVALAERAKANARVREEDVRPTVACPSCATTMKRVRVENAATIDVCADHGTWFDAGELQYVASIAGRREMDARLQSYARAAPAPREASTGRVALGAAVVGLEVLGAILGSSRR